MDTSIKFYMQKYTIIIFIYYINNLYTVQLLHFFFEYFLILTIFCEVKFSYEQHQTY